MGFAAQGGGFQAFTHGAVGAGDRHRADVLRRIRAFPRGLQHGRHLAGADPFGAGQAGAVFHHQVRRGDAFFGQPLAHDTLRGLGIVAIGIVAKLCTQAQEQLLGHGVVTVFVDVTDDLRQVR